MQAIGRRVSAQIIHAPGFDLAPSALADQGVISQELNQDVSKPREAQRPEVSQLPVLGSLGKRAEPIRDLYRLWTQPFDGHRSLKDVCKRQAPGMKRWSSRQIQTTAQKIRYIAIVVDLPSMSRRIGETDAICRVTHFFKSESITLDCLAKRIVSELAKNKLKIPNQTLFAEDIVQMPEYEQADLFWDNWV